MQPATKILDMLKTPQASESVIKPQNNSIFEVFIVSPCRVAWSAVICSKIKFGQFNGHF